MHIRIQFLSTIMLHVHAFTVTAHSSPPRSVDKGKGRTEVQASQGVFDPILSEFKIPPSPEVAAKSSKRPQSAPHARPSTAPSTPLRMDKQLQEARGTRDPITVSGE